jgi:hypothetical protein
MRDVLRAIQTEQDHMQKLTGVTAAFAAGIMTFAVGTANGAPMNLRADQGFIAAHAKIAMPKIGQRTKTRRSATARVEKVAAVKKRVSHRHRRRSGIHIDRMTTASIGPKGRGMPTAAAAGEGGQYAAIIARYAASYGVPVSLANAVVKIESNYRPNMIGRAGEIGLMQIKPATARMMGYSGSSQGLFDPETNIEYGIKYLAMARELGGGTTCGTILKYNAGHAATRMNPVSAAYCGKVKVQLAAFGAPA